MSIRFWQRWALAAVATFGLTTGSVQAAEQQTLNFGIISTESTQAQQDLFKPFLHDLAEQTGMKVKPFFATDYAGVIQAMRFNKVDVAWFGNKSAMEAVDHAGGQIFAQTVPDNGEPGYWSLMIVNRNSPWHTVDDVLTHASELTFGNGDPNSTSGYLVPGYYIFAKRGIDPKSAFKRTLNSSHETNALAVANQQVDVATFNTESMARLKETHPDAAQKLRVIWKSPLIPSDPLVWRENLADSTKQKLRQFFFNYGKTPEQKKVLAKLQWSGFDRSSNAQLLPIRQISLYRQRQEIEHDDSLSANEQQQKIAAIDKRLKQIDQQMDQQQNRQASQTSTTDQS